MKMGKRVAVAACLVLLASGCRKQSQAAGPRPVYTTIDWSSAGTIEGTVHYAGTPPKPIQIDMNQDPACTLGPPNYSQGYVVNHGDFANVFVYVKDGLGNQVYAAPSQPVDLDQKGCRYIPHVLGVMAGQPVRFTNSDLTMHNIHMMPTVAGNSMVDISQPPASGQNSVQDQRTFDLPELMIPVRCNDHPWMQAFLNVARNPFYAVSDRSGHYVIRGLPPGRYTLVADQENLGQKTAMVTVAAKQTATQDFTYEKGPATPQS
jgi:plastocyanin